ncbi:MAG TPA: thioredoxin domain-containing protein [Bryobacteraceae bacterium]|jgi:protein-disulfide isomerase
MRLFACLFLFSALLPAQTSAVSTDRAGGLPGVNVSGLTTAQKAQVLAIARQQTCTCGCPMKTSVCLAQDRSCLVSRAQATAIARELKAGKTPAAAAAILANASYMTKVQDELANQPVTLKLAGAPVRGPESARITIVEFSDFQCPFCQAGATALTEIGKEFPNDVKLVFKQFPLEFHSQAAIAAEASLAAQAQGKFWEMHDRIFANPKSLIEPNFIAWAKELGMDVPRFTSDLRSHKYAARVQTEEREGLDAGVQGTPTVFINGRLHRGNVTLEELKPAIEIALKAHH